MSTGIFGTPLPPVIPYSIDQIADLAKDIIACSYFVLLQYLPVPDDILNQCHLFYWLILIPGYFNFL